MSSWTPTSFQLSLGLQRFLVRRLHGRGLGELDDQFLAALLSNAITAGSNRPPPGWTSPSPGHISVRSAPRCPRNPPGFPGTRDCSAASPASRYPPSRWRRWHPDQAIDDGLPDSLVLDQAGPGFEPEVSEVGSAGLAHLRGGDLGSPLVSLWSGADVEGVNLIGCKRLSCRVRGNPESSGTRVITFWVLSNDSIVKGQVRSPSLARSRRS